MNENEFEFVKHSRVHYFQVFLYFLFYIIIGGISTSFHVSYKFMFDEKLPNNVVSWIVSSYFNSFLITGLMGGPISRKYGFKWPMVVLMCIISLTTLTIPYLKMAFGHRGVTACIIVQGLCTGIIFPMPADFISKWIPRKQKNILGTIIYASSVFGYSPTLFLSTRVFDLKRSWVMFFVFLGTLALIWTVIMVIYGADSPEDYFRNVQKNELDYVIRNREKTMTTTSIPWNEILASKPFWAIVFAQIQSCWLFYYLSDLSVFLELSESRNNIIGIIVIFFSWVSSFFMSCIAKAFFKNEIKDIALSRKLVFTIGCLIPAIVQLFQLIDWLPTHYKPIIYTMMWLSSGGTLFGSSLNVNDITSNFASVIFGTAHWIGLICMAIVFPLITNGSKERTYIISLVLFVGANTFYWMFSSIERQHWDYLPQKNDENPYPIPTGEKNNIEMVNVIELK